MKVYLVMRSDPDIEDGHPQIEKAFYREDLALDYVADDLYTDDLYIYSIEVM